MGEIYSSEVRSKKPYALPVQCIPCAGLKESDLHRIVNELLREMVAHKMKVAGTLYSVREMARYCSYLSLSLSHTHTHTHIHDIPGTQMYAHT